ncbi:hypothetical protein ACLK1T_07410 [Escherichia coli]
MHADIPSAQQKMASAVEKTCDRAASSHNALSSFIAAISNGAMSAEQHYLPTSARHRLPRPLRLYKDTIMTILMIMKCGLSLAASICMARKPSSGHPTCRARC